MPLPPNIFNVKAKICLFLSRLGDAVVELGSKADEIKAGKQNRKKIGSSSRYVVVEKIEKDNYDLLVHMQHQLRMQMGAMDF